MLYSWIFFPKHEKDKGAQGWRENLLEAYQPGMGFCHTSAACSAEKYYQI